MTMWNQLQTDAYEGMIAETVTLKGHNGDTINAYYARPAGPGPFPGVVWVHHGPGWDEITRESVRRLAQHGYATISPHQQHRFGQGMIDDVMARARAVGGVPDATIIGDSEAAMQFLKAQPYSNGKVGIIGPCAGGRFSVLVASSVQGFDACVDLWGGRVIQAEAELTPERPVAPISLTKNLNCPILGIFGNDDQGPSPEQVNQHEEELKKHGKAYEFHRYDGAGHGFFSYDRPAYRQEQTMDAWNKVFAFFGKHL